MSASRYYVCELAGGTVRAVQNTLNGAIRYLKEGRYLVGPVPHETFRDHLDRRQEGQS